MRSFGHTRNHKPSPVRARTNGGLGRNYGPDSRKRLVLSCDGADLITLRAERNRRQYSISATDLYALLVRRHAATAKQKKKAKRLTVQKRYSIL